MTVQAADVVIIVDAPLWRLLRNGVFWLRDQDRQRQACSVVFEPVSGGSFRYADSGALPNHSSRSTSITIIRKRVTVHGFSKTQMPWRVASF